MEIYFYDCSVLIGAAGYDRKPSMFSQMCKSLIILSHVDPLLGNDSEISNHTMSVTKQRPINCNRETVFSRDVISRAT
jgi:hypothetical protein